MERLQTIVVGTDLTEAALPSVRRAVQLAHGHGAQLELLHVIEPDWLLAVRDAMKQKDLQAAVEEQCRMQLAAIAGQIAADTPVRPAIGLRTGSPTRELAAASSGADLMVVGAGGGKQLRDAALGTTASRLARLVKRPLLVVRNAADRSYARVLVATDFSEASARALHEGMRLAPEADFQLVHCHELAYEGRLRMAGTEDGQLAAYRDHGRAMAQQQAQDLLTGLDGGSRVRTVVRHGDARFELLAAAKAFDADLIVVGKQGRSFLMDTLLGSVTTWLLGEAGCDVLVVPSAPSV